MIIEFASEVSNLAWRVSQSQNGGAIFTLTKRSPMFGSVVFDHQWCILIVMSVKSSFYNEYDIKNNEKHVLWAQRSFKNHHQTFHDRCPEKIGPLPKKSNHWFTWTCPENIRPAPTCLLPSCLWPGAMSHQGPDWHSHWTAECNAHGCWNWCSQLTWLIRWRPVLYFPDSEFHTLFFGQVPISSLSGLFRTCQAPGLAAEVDRLLITSAISVAIQLHAHGSK